VKKTIPLTFVILYGIVISCSSQTNSGLGTKLETLLNNNIEMEDKIIKTDEEWKNKLTEDEYRILRQKGTDPAYSNKYYKHTGDGTYVCAGCGNELFKSKTKYNSGSGWPSFYDAIAKDKIKTKLDESIGMKRVELMCAKCDGHLGHVFDDGPNPTGLRYCVNSSCLDFKKEE